MGTVQSWTGVRCDWFRPIAYFSQKVSQASALRQLKCILLWCSKSEMKDLAGPWFRLWFQERFLFLPTLGFCLPSLICAIRIQFLSPSGSTLFTMPLPMSLSIHLHSFLLQSHQISDQKHPNPGRLHFNLTASVRTHFPTRSPSQISGVF